MECKCVCLLTLSSLDITFRLAIGTNCGLSIIDTKLNQCLKTLGHIESILCEYHLLIHTTSPPQSLIYQSLLIQHHPLNHSSINPYSFNITPSITHLSILTHSTSPPQSLINQSSLTYLTIDLADPNTYTRQVRRITQERLDNPSSPPIYSQQFSYSGDVQPCRRLSMELSINRQISTPLLYAKHYEFQM